MSYFGNRDFYLEVSKGNITGHTLMHKFGNNDTVGTSYEDIWGGGSIWMPPTTARIHQITSGSINDDEGGSGAEKVQVYGLDNNFELQDEEVILNGTGNVATANTYTMIHRMIVTQSNNGANDSFNAGIITATADTDGTVTAQIDVGMNQTLMAIYQIPAGKTGYLLDFYATISEASPAANGVTVRLFVQPWGFPWATKELFAIQRAGSSSREFGHRAPDSFLAKTIIKMQAMVDSNSSGVSAGFDILLVDD